MNAFPQLVLAQVEAVYPETFELGCVFSTHSSLHSVKVKVTAEDAGPYTGEFKLPKVGEFGLCAFFADDANTAVWLKGVPSKIYNVAPLEILAQDPTARVRHHRDGSHEIFYTNGDHEKRLADGTLIRATHSKDGSESNTTGRAKVTEIVRSEDENPGINARIPKREPYEPPVLPPVDLHILHSSGTHVTLTADGSLFAETAKGHKLEVDDATEKVRGEDGSVTSSPDESGQRKTSGIRLETEKGIKVTLNDDPVTGTNRYVRAELPTGTKVELLTGGGKEKATIKTAGGNELTLDDTGLKNTMKSARGQTIEQGAASTKVSDPALIEISAPITKVDQTVFTGGGGPPVARLGDQIFGQGVGNLGIPVIVTGTIITGAAKTFSG